MAEAHIRITKRHPSDPSGNPRAREVSKVEIVSPDGSTFPLKVQDIQIFYPVSAPSVLQLQTPFYEEVWV